MEDVLTLYARVWNPKYPTVCLDEKLYQLLAHTREPLPTQPGKPKLEDYTYKRKGTRNLFILLAPQAGWRHVKVTKQRTAIDYAECLRDLVDIHFPDAEKILIVQDNLNTHKGGSLYEAFPAAEARRIYEKLEFHYTPKHASWLNMAEIDLHALSKQCLSRRIDCQELLKSEISAWEQERNEHGVIINWQFTTQKARDKFKKHYDKLKN